VNIVKFCSYIMWCTI